MIVGYGIIVPILLFGPFYLLSTFEFKNVMFILCLVGAVPNLLLLRVIEALHQLTPSFAKDDVGMLMLYFSASLRIKFDSKTKTPVPFTFKLFISKLTHFVSAFLQASLLYSVLIAHNYVVAPERPIHGILDLYYWGNILNAFLMASLTSVVLDGGASGLGLLTSLCTGVTLEPFSDYPMTQSSSPSDFWANRWDRPAASALRRGAFQPLRQAGYSRNAAAVLTFVVSGLIHEYVLLLMAARQGIPNNPSQETYQPAHGRQFFFFVWNAIVLMAERSLEGHPIISWMQSNVPKSVRTALVLLTVLPVSHLFTDEYIRSCFFSDAAFGFPIITYSRTQAY